MPEKLNLSDKIWNRIFSIPWVTQLWAKLKGDKNSSLHNAPIPFSRLKKPFHLCRAALITTGGIHLPDQTPFDMENPDGDAGYRELPADVATGQIVITHKYYDHRDADRDVNIIFPIDRFRELVDRQVIGELAPRHFGFMGHIEGDQLPILLEKKIPEVIEKLKTDEVDIVLLTPA